MSVSEMTAVQENSSTAESARWNPLTRIAFRFCFLYFGLFCLLYPQLISYLAGWIVAGESPADAATFQVHLLQPILAWVGRNVFGANAVPLAKTGSGDQTIFWVLLFCILVVSVAGTALWTLLDRRRREYRRLAGWFLLFIRLCVAGQVMSYGVAKLIPTQMPSPALRTLLTPFGDFGPMEVLWNQVGTSQPYEMLLGAAEVLGGMLLFIPRTATVGAMLSLVDMAMVFVMDMCFDVPVRILSGHLMLMSLLVLAPEARRLTTVLVLGRATGPSTAPYPFRGGRARWIATAAQLALGVWALTAFLPDTLRFWREDHPAASPVSGIWSVAQFTRDGIALPPLTTDETRWRRLIFDPSGAATYQLMDDRLVDVQATVDTAAHRVALSSTASKPLAAFTFRPDGPDRLELTGELNGHPVTIVLDRIDPNSFPLRSTRFHWVQDLPSDFSAS